MLSVDAMEEGDPQWNTRLIKSGLATVYQTKEWGEIVSKLGQKPIFLKFVGKNGDIVGQLMITTVSRFGNKGGIRSILKKTLTTKNMIFKWTYGPILFNSELNRQLYETLGNFLLSKKCKVSGSEHPHSNSMASILQNNFKLELWNTFLFDLTQSKESLYNKIDKHSGKKNIERAIKRGVTIEEINDKSLIEYYELLEIQKKSQGQQITDFQNLLEAWKLFKPLGYSGLLARKNGKTIGGLLFSFLNNYIIEAGVARSQYDSENKLYSQDLIKWKIVEWGIQNNMKYYDLAGVNPNPTSDKEK